MILLELFLTFAKIGLFTIGGGYAMIPLIQEEIIRRNWLTLEGVIDILAISEMTPGPFAINAATFIGIQQAGIPGAIFATTGVITPSFIIVLLVARYFTKFKDHSLVQGLLTGIRPAVIGLIATATFSIMKSVFSITASSIFTLVNLKGIVILGLVLVGIYKLKIHPALMIIISAILGMLFFTW
ncbi:MAG: chromate transporter [Caldicoprobacterales bacterium]|nr:chromate transporter [Clostridia bacterium]MDI9512952.1 chromate transporter [Bacillota bacterium]NLH58373.1 chromate transporter [Clostridiales bacterium]